MKILVLEGDPSTFRAPSDREKFDTIATHESLNGTTITIHTDLVAM